jgi:beta-lactamase superfamily II metal-dependent hydrolase
MPRFLKFLAPIFFVAAPLAAQNTLGLYFINVGQGDATLIVGPTGKTCLIDAGNAGDGLGDILPKLNQLGVTQLDFSVATHWHSDHMGGFAELRYNGFWPVVAYDRGLDPSLATQFTYSNYHAAMGAHRAAITLGQVLDMGGGASLQCVAVNGQPLGGAPVSLSGTAQIENNRSVVMKLTYGDFEAVVGGDLEGGFSGTADVESAAAAAVGDVDVYKVHHHGSDTSTNSFFLAQIKPEIAVVPCGDNNPYGHPHQAPVNALLATPELLALYRLETCNPATLSPGNPAQQVVGGDLTILTDGAQYTVSGPGIATVTHPVDEGGPTFAWAPLDLVVSELMPNPKGPSGSPIADADGEWIEIRNNRPESVNLLGVTVRDQGVDSFVLPAIVVPAFGFVTVGRNANAALNGGLVFDFIAPTNELVLSNSADEIELVAPGGLVLDAVAYGTGTGLAVPNGSSLERINCRAPALAANFTTGACCYFPLGATPCVCSGANTQWNFGTPRALNSADQTPPYAYFSVVGSTAPGSLFTFHLAVFGSAGKNYVMAASASTSPPFVLSDGRTIDLAYDFLMTFAFTPGNGVFSNLTGVMNFLGSAQAPVQLPADPGLSGLSFYAGGLVLDPAQPSGVGAISPPHLVAVP